MTRVLGLDPGIHGGLAIIEALNDAVTVVDAIDIPVVGVGAKERVDVRAFANWITQHGPALAFVERAQAMPKQGASSGFKYGRATGALEAAIILCSIPLEIVEPSMWKRSFRLPGGDKESTRQRALELFPAAHGLLARKRGHGRAEAALIGLFGLKTSRLMTAPPGAQPGSINGTPFEKVKQ
jgi:crossover junction endodeoxyribonuclease RuvC